MCGSEGCSRPPSPRQQRPPTVLLDEAVVARPGTGPMTTGRRGRAGACVAAVAAGDLTRAEALLQITEADLDLVLHAHFEGAGAAVLTRGLGASPGAAVGRVYLTADACVEAADRGELVVLVREETSPEDVHGMQVAEGILTSRGGLASHAAVVARGWGIPAVVGAERWQIGDGGFTVGDVVVREGDVISLDGATGEVVLGERGVAEAEVPARARGPPRVGRRGPGRTRRRARQRRHRRRRRRSRSRSAPRASGCAAPSTCSSPRTGCRSCGRCCSPPTRRGRRSRSSSSAPRSATTSPRILRGARRSPRHRPPARPAAARVPPVGRVAARRARRARPQRGRGGAARGGRVVARAEPDARHAWRAPRRAQARPLRDAGASAARGGGGRSRRRAATRSSR